MLVLLAAAPVDRARELTAALRFKAVVELLEPRRAELDSDGIDLYARALVALGRHDDAETAWVELLRRDPDADGPNDGSPKVRAVFERARARLDELPPLPRRPGKTRAVKHRKRAALIATREAEPAPSIDEQATPPAVAGELPVASAGDTGAPVAEPPPEPAALGLAPPPLLPAPQPMPIVELEAAPSAQPRWIPWTAAAAAVLLAGVGAALALWSNADAQSARTARFASDARDLDGRAFRSAAASNALFGGALVLGVTSGFLFWRWR